MAQVFVCDVTDFNQIKNAVNKVVKKFGTIDILINNAGVWFNYSKDNVDQTKIENVIKVNTLAPYYFVNVISPYLKNKILVILYLLIQLLDFSTPKIKIGLCIQFQNGE